MSDTREEQVRWPDGVVTLETVESSGAGDRVLQSHRGVAFYAVVDGVKLQIVHSPAIVSNSPDQAPDAEELEEVHEVEPEH